MKFRRPDPGNGPQAARSVFPSNAVRGASEAVRIAQQSQNEGRQDYTERATRELNSMGGKVRAGRIVGRKAKRTAEQAGRGAHAAAKATHSLAEQLPSATRLADALGQGSRTITTRAVRLVVDYARRSVAAVVTAVTTASTSTVAIAAGVILCAVAAIFSFLPILDWLDQSETAAYACAQPSTGASGTAVPPQAQPWLDEAVKTSGLPATYIAAIWSIESSFNPNAHAADSNGGTWGLFQMNRAEWNKVYPADAQQTTGMPHGMASPDNQATYGGKYLATRLASVKTIVAAHQATLGSLPILDALTIAHNAGEGALERWPDIPPTTKSYLAKLHELMGNTTCAAGGPAGPMDLSTNGPCPMDQPGGVSCNTAIGWALGQQHAGADWYEHCLGFVTTAYGGVWLGIGSAADAGRMLDSEGKIVHTTDYASIPRGAVLWWTGGSQGYGHVAISIGGGNAISTDVPHGHEIGEEPIAWFQSNWNETWLGYSAPVR